MKRRWKIFIVAVAVSIVALLPIIHHYHLRAATDAYIAKLKTQGEPMDIAQVTPPPVPPEQNSADTFRQAAALLKDNEDWWSRNTVGGMQMVAPGRAMILWQQPHVREYDHTISWPEISNMVANDEKAFGLLQQIIAKPDFDFQVHYERGFGGFEITHLYLAESKRAAQRLSTAALSDLHNGDTTSAVENVRAMLAIAQGMQDERFVISELVRIAIARIAADATWDLLQSSNLTDTQLAQLQQDWTAQDFIQSYENALEMERVAGEITTAGERQSNAHMKDVESFYHFKGGEVFMWRYWRSYPDELRALKGWQTLITSTRMVQTNGSFQDALDYQQHKLDELGIMKLLNIDSNSMPIMNLRTMQSQSIASLSAVIRRVLRSEVAKETVVTAIALKRYQLKHGNYPPDLKALVPEFLPAVPLDPVDGQPLRYHTKENGTFLLYSVAENYKDDGGNPALEQGIQGSNFDWLNYHALDWVWPQPATEKEIQNYYAHQPK